MIFWKVQKNADAKARNEPSAKNSGDVELPVAHANASATFNTVESVEPTYNPKTIGGHQTGSLEEELVRRYQMKWVDAVIAVGRAKASLGGCVSGKNVLLEAAYQIHESGTAAPSRPQAQGIQQYQDGSVIQA